MLEPEQQLTLRLARHSALQYERLFPQETQITKDQASHHPARGFVRGGGWMSFPHV